MRLVHGGIVAVALALAGLAACTGKDDMAVKPADYVASSAGVEIAGGTELPTGPSLVGPHFGLWFTTAMVLTQHVVEQYKAAPGHELLYLYPDPATHLPAYPGSEGIQLTASVVVDGATRPMDRLPYTGLIVSVPKGHDATLRVEDDGRVQSLDVRTGKRGADAVAGYYRPHDLLPFPLAYQDTGTASYAHAVATVNVSVTAPTDPPKGNGSVEPWIPVKGWSKDGRAWLLLSGLQVASTSSVDGPVQARAALLELTYAVNVNRSFPVTGNDGHVYDPLPQPPRNTADYNRGFAVTLVYDVPDGFGSGALAIQPTGDFFGPTELVFQPGDKPLPFTWSKRLDAQQVPLATGR